LSTKPPFRADHVGSLLRPLALREARADRAAGRITSAELREIENIYIRHAIEQQKAIGLKAVTDGEFRRAFWHFDFLVAWAVLRCTRATRASNSRAAPPRPMGCG
jgi:5-methyltetrahydropteroyltriglutamate--homocysteine methyltransferase